MGRRGRKHRLDGSGLMVATERRSNLLVMALEALVELKKVAAARR